MMLGSKMGGSGVRRQSSQERQTKDLRDMKMEVRVSPWLTPALMTERTSWAESIGLYFPHICFLVLRSASRTLPGLVAKAKGLVSRQEFATSTENARPLRVTSKSRRALERHALQRFGDQRIQRVTDCPDRNDRVVWSRKCWGQTISRQAELSQ